MIFKDLMKKTYEQLNWEFAANDHKRYKNHLKSSVTQNVPSLKNYFENRIKEIEQRYPSLKGVTYD
jgi:hypothetical protein